jgi:hypothetical protein
MEASPGFRLLADARAVVASGWCQGADARGADGAAIEPWDERAVSWSLLGAIVAVLEQRAADEGEIPLEELAAALYALADVIETDSLERWNDEPRRSQNDVVNILAAAEDRFEPVWPEQARFQAN